MQFATFVVISGILFAVALTGLVTSKDTTTGIVVGFALSMLAVSAGILVALALEVMGKATQIGKAAHGILVLATYFIGFVGVTTFFDGKEVESVTEFSFAAGLSCYLAYSDYGRRKKVNSTRQP